MLSFAPPRIGITSLQPGWIACQGPGWMVRAMAKVRARAKVRPRG